MEHQKTDIFTSPNVSEIAVYSESHEIIDKEKDILAIDFSNFEDKLDFKCMVFT